MNYFFMGMFTVIFAVSLLRRDGKWALISGLMLALNIAAVSR